MKFNYNRRTRDLEIITDDITTIIDIYDSQKGVKQEIIDTFSEILAEMLLDYQSNSWFNNELVNRIFLNLNRTVQISEIRELLRELNIDINELKEEQI